MKAHVAEKDARNDRNRARIRNTLGVTALLRRPAAVVVGITIVDEAAVATDLGVGVVGPGTRLAWGGRRRRSSSNLCDTPVGGGRDRVEGLLQGVSTRHHILEKVVHGGAGQSEDPVDRGVPSDSKHQSA